jgi:hypothetical protein
VWPLGAQVRHPGDPLDHGSDARQRPQVSVEPGRHRATVQHLSDAGQLGWPEPCRLAVAGGAHPDHAAITPAPPPAARGLRRDAQVTGDFAFGLSLLEQVGGLQPAAFQPLQISRVSQRLAIGGDG